MRPLPPNKALQLTSARGGVASNATQSSLALAGRLTPAGGGAPWATVSAQQRSQLSADPLGELKVVDAVAETLTERGESIRRYKGRANEEGAVAWSAVPCAPDIVMHIPKFDVEAVGAAEINTKVFGLLASAGIRQELLEIRELGQYVTCFLRVTDGSATWDAVEVFLFDANNRVAEIWAL